MLYFAPWALLILAVIIAVPVAHMRAPGPVVGGGSTEPEMDDMAGVVDENSVIDDFGGPETGDPAQPLSDDAFADFN